MWEKIVFNLLSNAFKFTFQGGVKLVFFQEGEEAVLEVSDTGTGIPRDELPHIFERFHRVQNARARTHEGTGIGLALVHDLVKLHGGSISVESTVGTGTRFFVRIPLGKEHVPADQIREPSQRVSTALHREVFIEEAGVWLPPENVGNPVEIQSTEPVVANPGRLPLVLVADDNQDMREYISRLLRGRCEVVAVSDGKEALAAAQKRRPDLILSDIMMPHLNGFEFLSALRQDVALKTVSVILLSARAGEEARLEGIREYADDYLTKPFSGQELVARVETHLKLSQIREEAAARERSLNKELEQRVEERTASLTEAIAQLEEFSYTVSHDLRAPLRGLRVYSDALLADYAPSLPEQARYWLQKIATNARMLDQMILDVLTFSRVARTDLKLEKIDLEKFVRQILEQHPAPHAEIQIQSLPEILGHLPSLTQAFSNLFNNAVKFVTPGVTPKIRIWSERHDGYVRIWVEDNGIGIDPKYQHRLFRMFERVHPHLKYDGTGVGLAIVRKAMERMGGKVGVESDGVHGSKFWLEVQPAN
jgi:signal transduction histidine kinase